ncbi:MAG: helix-turn-helix transcriptional regulator [Flavobacteriales bacterium]|nr:helix-turn-helix transcriptional regulator [Flavobacteriales bacterium]
MQRTRAHTPTEAPQLSDRQLECIQVLCGNPEPTVEQAADIMGLSVNTVLTHRRHVYQKLGVHCRLDLYHRARDLGLLVCSCCKKRHDGQKESGGEEEEGVELGGNRGGG